MKKDFEDRFWGNVTIPTNVVTECWEWQGGTYSHNGYPLMSFQMNGRTLNRRASRIAFELSNGFLDDGEVVMHICDNRNCVNVSHLRRGTQAQNLADRDAKQRQARGASCGRSKLTEAQVLRIRELAPTTRRSVIAAEFGICFTTVTMIIKRRTWKHI